MDSRMNKYHENNNESLSRVSRHEELYKEINNSGLDNFTVKSNATVLGTQENEIYIEKIKKILDTKYKETAKRRSIRLETNDEDVSIVPESTTKEYDLNTFLSKARDDKEETYEEARAKKLRDTQYDILTNLNIETKEEEEKKEDADLMNLINTITINEVKKKESKNISNEDSEGDPLDILTELKGDENTEVFEGIKEEIERIEKTSKIMEHIKSDEVTEESKKEEEKKEEKNNNLDTSFFTTHNLFKKRDLVGGEFAEEEKMAVWVKVLIVLLVIAFLAGLVLFLKSFLNL